MLQLFLLTFITGIRVVVLMFRCIQDIVETLIGYCKSFSRHSTFQINENVVSLQCCILTMLYPIDGCFWWQVCKQFNTQASNVFGRRNDPVELSVDGDCCTGDLCNHVVLTHGTSTFTTMSPPTGSKQEQLNILFVLKDVANP